jgi:hypothetical protein
MYVVNVRLGGKLRGFLGHLEVHGQHSPENVIHHGQGWCASLAEGFVQLMCRFHHGFVLLISLVSARRAPHPSVPCHDVPWGYFRQAFCNMRDHCEHF